MAKAKVSKTKTAKREAAPIRPVKETFTKAALINLIFNSRCVASVAFVWLAGRWFRNAEARAGRHAMLRRLAGSALMLGALALALR